MPEASVQTDREEVSDLALRVEQLRVRAFAAALDTREAYTALHTEVRRVADALAGLYRVETRLATLLSAQLALEVEADHIATQANAVRAPFLNQGAGGVGATGSTGSNDANAVLAPLLGRGAGGVGASDSSSSSDDGLDYATTTATSGWGGHEGDADNGED